jgi:hypothetical protein
MIQTTIKPLRKSLPPGWLKAPAERREIQTFIAALRNLLRKTTESAAIGEREEHFKTDIRDFLLAAAFPPEKYYSNTSDAIDLAVHTGARKTDPLGVLFEIKRPSNTAEMFSPERPNAKALHELVLYYLQLRHPLSGKPADAIRHLIITNGFQWFLFDAQEFERCFNTPDFRRLFKTWNEDQFVKSNTAFFYEKASALLAESETTLPVTSINFADPIWQKILAPNADLSQPELKRALLPAFKALSSTFLLKEAYASDSNSLNRDFYRELLYLIGLEEATEKNQKLIRRVTDPAQRQSATLLENAIAKLKSERVLSHLPNRLQYGATEDEQLFEVALQLCITWVNRLLFLKLMEAQLVRYHGGDTRFQFLNRAALPEFDDLNSLFFDVLAVAEADREPGAADKFRHVPYLNSSLFETTPLEGQTLRISNLRDHLVLPLHRTSVLRSNPAYKNSDGLETLEYLFAFLNAYDFSAEGSEDIREERKSLINASVLGLIFEKINGYKDGSFYTPGFITEYMCRESLRAAVMRKCNTQFNWACESFSDLYNYIRPPQIPAVNEVINSLTICDPAVGSGHFLVSALNELLAIKSDLGVLCDRDGKVLRDLTVRVERDELLAAWSDDTFFEYRVALDESSGNLRRTIPQDLQRVQEALFHEKERLIENTLFGVDLNPNSVKICRLRLWIELLKHAYFTAGSRYASLQVLPNIDINIKEGNSLVSRFALSDDLSETFKKQRLNLKTYRLMVQSYKSSNDKEAKAQLLQEIQQIKDSYKTSLLNNLPINRDLSRVRGELAIMDNPDLFGTKTFTEKQKTDKKKELAALEAQKQEQQEGRLYTNAFEWRFEFPEVLNERGDFTGFDVVIGNPPYIRQEELTPFKPYFERNYAVYQGTADLYTYFIERGLSILNENGNFHFIVPNKWMRANYGKPLRTFLNGYAVSKLIDFGDLPVFEEATTYPCLLSIEQNQTPHLFDAAIIPGLNFEHLADEIKRHRFEIDQTRLSEDGWTLANTGVQKLMDKLRKAGTPLGEYVGGKIYYGIKTGLNEAFVIDEATKDALITEDPKSAEIIKPFLAGRDIKRYVQPKADKYLILFKNGWTNANRGKLDGWKFIETTFPAVAEYLKPFEEKAAARYDKGQYWWELRACDYYDAFDKPKLLYQEIATFQSFTIDHYGNYLNNKLFFTVTDPKFLIGLLNSNLVWWFLSQVSSKLRGDAFALQSPYMYQVPVIDSAKSKIESLVNQILAAKAANSAADTSAQEREIDQLVYQLYGLTEEEIRIVEGGE